ncbi:MAG: hypothetical protein AAF907_00705 [Planctomycetota bacterium]
MIDAFDPTLNTLLFNVGPSLLHLVLYVAMAALAVRRWRENTPGSAAVAAAAGCWILSALAGFAWSIPSLIEPGGDWWDHPLLEVAGLINLVAWFAAPPLLLWGLILTWRGYDRAAAGQADVLE